MAKLWGGRFSKKTHPLVEEFTKSIHFDQKLAKYDVLGSYTHIQILKKAGLITTDEYARLAKALTEIRHLIESPSFFKNIDNSYEDIHSYIQKLVENKAGKAALKLHTCRSRNDQVVFDLKSYTLIEAGEIIKSLNAVIETIKALARKNSKLKVPGYTHLQHAIPIPLPDYWGAYIEMLMRDRQRVAHAVININLTMGAGALAGTMIQASQYNVAAGASLAKPLKPSANSIDAVSDRDFVIETLSALAIIGMHLSRLAEDMILWASKEFDFIDIDDAFCTGSSLMPQKKNPDVLELVRGYSGRLYGNLVNVLVMMKGLPLSYNRDMQLDKEPLFDSFKIVQDELKVLTELFKNIKFKKENIAKQLDDETLYATDLADHLVKNKVAFKDAHTIIGKLVKHKLVTEKSIVEMSADELKSFHPSLTPNAVKKIIDPDYSVKSKKSVRKRKL